MKIHEFQEKMSRKKKKRVMYHGFSLMRSWNVKSLGGDPLIDAQNFVI